MSQARARVSAVLIAEDETLLALNIEEIVTGLGHRVIGPVARIEHLLQLIQETQPDAALLDVSLAQGANTYAAADLLRARGIPFAFMTAYDAGGIDRKYAQVPILRKPYTVADVELCLAMLTHDNPTRRADAHDVA